jgi:hypothetical protein
MAALFFCVGTARKQEFSTGLLFERLKLGDSGSSEHVATFAGEPFSLVLLKR